MLEILHSVHKLKPRELSYQLQKGKSASRQNYRRVHGSNIILRPEINKTKEGKYIAVDITKDRMSIKPNITDQYAKIAELSLKKRGTT